MSPTQESVINHAKNYIANLRFRVFHPHDRSLLQSVTFLGQSAIKNAQFTLSFPLYKVVSKKEFAFAFIALASIEKGWRMGLETAYAIGCSYSIESSR